MFRTGLAIFAALILAQVPNPQQHEQDSQLLARIGPSVHPGCMRYNPKADPQDVRAYREAFAREAKWHEWNKKDLDARSAANARKIGNILENDRAAKAKQKKIEDYYHKEAIEIEKRGKIAMAKEISAARNPLDFEANRLEKILASANKPGGQPISEAGQESLRSQITKLRAMKAAQRPVAPETPPVTPEEARTDRNTPKTGAEFLKHFGIEP